MIMLTRLTGRPMIVNVELIKTVEETPDTTITLVNNDRIMVSEPMAEVVRRAIEYGRQIRCFTPLANIQSAGHDESDGKISR
jgi:flagellar protein FlbD